LTDLVHDEDEVVRRAVAYRLPQTQLNQLIDDPDREVRMTVADRIAPEELEKLANDPDYIVRLTVARRLRKDACFVLFAITICKLEKWLLNGCRKSVWGYWFMTIRLKSDALSLNA